MGATHFSGPVVSAAGFVGSGISSNEDPNAAGGASSFTLRRTGLADAVPISIITVNVPNAVHDASIFLEILAHLENGESSRVALGAIAVTRKAVVATAAVAAALAVAQIATVAAGGTFTLAYAVSAITGANNATQTFSISVTLTGTPAGTYGVMMSARVMNSYANGVTVAAS
jgi:hypothetical protein